MQFREMHPQDVAGVFRVRTSTCENRLSMEDLKLRGITPESVIRILENRAKGWVCEVKNEIAGFTMGDGRSGEVLVLAVSPQAEGKGIGRKLMKRVQQWLFSQGHEELWLLENPDPSIRAYSFYRKLGWVATGEIRDGEQVLKLSIKDFRG